MSINVIIEVEKLMNEPHEMRDDLRAGCGSIGDSDLAAICEAMTDIEEEKDIHRLFTTGALAAFSFLTCTEGSDMHGTTLEEFMANAWDKTQEMFVISALLDKLTGGAR